MMALWTHEWVVVLWRGCSCDSRRGQGRVSKSRVSAKLIRNDSAVLYVRRVGEVTEEKMAKKSKKRQREVGSGVRAAIRRTAEGPSYQEVDDHHREVPHRVVRVRRRATVAAAACVGIHEDKDAEGVQKEDGADSQQPARTDIVAVAACVDCEGMKPANDSGQRIRVGACVRV